MILLDTEKIHNIWQLELSECRDWRGSRSNFFEKNILPNKFANALLVTRIKLCKVRTLSVMLAAIVS